MGSWSPVTPTGAGGERGWLWFSSSPSLTRSPGTQPHTTCPSCSSCPFAWSRKQGPSYWGSYTNARSLPKALPSLSGLGELRNNFHPILQWGTFIAGTHLMQGAGSQCFGCHGMCWECAAPKGTKCLSQAEVSLGSAIHRELIFPTVSELDTNALVFKAINASVV